MVVTEGVVCTWRKLKAGLGRGYFRLSAGGLEKLLGKRVSFPRPLNQL
jgi:hypothetical protein